MFALATLAGLGQAKAAHSKENPWPKKDSVAKVVPQQAPTYILILSQADKEALYNFILDADVYSEKGRQNFLRNLDQKVRLLAMVPDTTKK